ncbi:MAG: cytochrome c3 family protein [Desulfuromonadaceae bacterium]|nr:cytochrome c3 family protein [Desulfuromonadaceae bacterium]MDD2854506.1 cytochrome c3 family protein [Desulfuromonadaceae bacterium]
MFFKFIYSLTFVTVLLYASLLFAANETPIHLDKKNMRDGCASCHMGFNFSDGGGAYRCVSCHGSSNFQAGYVTQGVQLKDITKDFSKNYRHPVFDKKGQHSAREVLPEIDPSVERHVTCADCHSPHFVSASNPYAGISGKKVGNLVTQITKEYELCYLCHSDSANLPVKSTNKRIEFSTNNPSFHPVEGEGKNQAVISLIRPYREKKSSAGDVSVLKCADCHSSDEPGAARGPHGSKYQGLLTDNYSIEDNAAESDFAYAICYRCHKRASILGNESFTAHSRHITGERGFKGGGTSCYTCHSSHGSVENRYLIRFNRDYVTESSTGKLKFVEKGTYTFHGECWLSCHGVDHNPKTY